MNRFLPFFLCVFLSASEPLWCQEDREAIRTTADAVRPSLVGLEVTLRKKTRLEKAELEEQNLDAEAQRIFQMSENEQIYESWGVAVAKDLIVMADRGLKESDVARIDAVDASGGRFEVKVHAVGRRHDFVLLKPAAPRELVPLEFADWKRPATGETFHVTYAGFVDGGWHLNVSPYILTNVPLAKTDDWLCIDLIRPGSVISDRAGAAVGIALDQYLWVHADGRSSFLGKGILADDRLENLAERSDAFRKALPASVKRVEFTFRAEKSPDRYGGEEAAGKTVLFGVAIDDRGTFFIPEGMPREVVRKIEDISVVDEGKSHEASFVGLFRAFGGMIVRAEGMKTAPGIVRDAKAPPPGEIFFTADFEDRFGRSRIETDYNRLFRTERGLGSAFRVQPRRRVKPGSFLLDPDGRIVGCATADKPEEDFDEVAAEATREAYLRRSSSGFVPDHLRRLLYFGEIADLLAQPAGHIDPRAVPMSKKDARRLVWLGVEFQEFSKPLAESLGVQERDLTNDGRRGLLITEIYPGSPAHKAGLQVDDVLLAVQPEGEVARDLVAEADRFGGYARGGMYFDRRSGAVQPPWKPAKNYLTAMLTEIGASKNVTFDVLRGKASSRVTLALEVAPVDYETAERFKDDGLGFTVKELTYEVRHYQKLNPSETGVVVAKVESGSKADVAKLAPLSIITRVNNVAVADLAAFKELVAKPRSLTLTTISHGQTKLIELSRQ